MLFHWVMLALLVILAVFVARAIRRRGVKAQETSWKPAELETARLAFAEKTFRVEWPFRLIARVDRAYRLANSTLVLTELKRRKPARAYASDVIELSAQKLALEQAISATVSRIGYVVAEHPVAPSRRTAIAVKLLGRNALVQLAARYEALQSGRVVPRKANHQGLCSKCVYNNVCRPDVLHRQSSIGPIDDDVPVSNAISKCEPRES